MTYLAIKRGISIKAAAVIGGVTDVKAWVDSRPEMNLVNGNPFIDGFRNIWPDYEHRADEEYRARPAVDWADQINVPILILHSRTDRMVPVTQAIRMADAPGYFRTSLRDLGTPPDFLPCPSAAADEGPGAPSFRGLNRAEGPGPFAWGEARFQGPIPDSPRESSSMSDLPCYRKLNPLTNCLFGQPD